MVDVSRDPRWGRASEGFGEVRISLQQWVKPWWKRCRVKVGRSLLGDDQRQTLCRIRCGRGGKEYNTVDMSPQRLFNDYSRRTKRGWTQAAAR